MNNNLDYKKKALQVSMENGIDKAPKVRKYKQFDPNICCNDP